MLQFINKYTKPLNFFISTLLSWRTGHATCC